MVSGLLALAQRLTSVVEAEPLAVLWSGVAEASALAQVRDVATSFAATVGFAGQQVDDVRMAVSEAFSNVVMHAYVDRTGGSVEVEAAYVGRRLELKIVDHGTGIRPGVVSPGLGIGLTMMAAVMDECLLLTTPGGGTTIVLCLQIDL